MWRPSSRPTARAIDVKSSREIGADDAADTVAISLVDAAGSPTSQLAIGPIEAGAGHAATGETIAKSISGPRQPAADRADRPAQASGGLVVSETFEVAKHDRRAVFLG